MPMPPSPTFRPTNKSPGLTNGWLIATDSLEDDPDTRLGTKMMHFLMNYIEEKQDSGNLTN